LIELNFSLEFLKDVKFYFMILFNVLRCIYKKNVLMFSAGGVRFHCSSWNVP